MVISTSRLCVFVFVSFVSLFDLYSTCTLACTLCITLYSSPSDSQYETVAHRWEAHTRVEVYGLYHTWFITHSFCPSEHWSNLIRHPTRSRSSLRLGPTDDFRFCVRVCRQQGLHVFALFRSVSFLLVYH